MGLDSGDPDGDLDWAGRKFDEIMTANRRGLVGFAHRYNPQKARQLTVGGLSCL